MEQQPKKTVTQILADAKEALAPTQYAVFVQEYSAYVKQQAQ